MVSCIEPGAVTPEDLVAHADGQAPEHVLAHLRRCSSCRAEAGSYAAWQGALRRGLHRFDCPSAHALGEYQIGLLPAEEGRRIAAHAAECPRCAEELRVLRSFLAVEPEPAVGVVERVRRLVARLIPTPLNPAQVGLRGGQSPSQTYQADGIGVALTPTPAPGTPTRPSDGYPSLRPGTRPGPGAGYPLAGTGRPLGGVGAGWGRGALIGLVWSEGTAGARLGGVAHLVASDGLTHEAPIDELGNFVFEDVAAGAGQLELRLDDAVVVVEDVPIGT